MGQVDITRHVPECNDLCVECVLWRKIEALKESYELKVLDFAAETLARSAAEAQVATLSAELDEAGTDADKLYRALLPFLDEDDAADVATWIIQNPEAAEQASYDHYRHHYCNEEEDND